MIDLSYLDITGVGGEVAEAEVGGEVAEAEVGGEVARGGRWRGSRGHARRGEEEEGKAASP